MAETTLPISQETKDELDEYRHPKHDSYDDVLSGMMTVLPTLEELHEGCDNAECDEKPWGDPPWEEVNGVLALIYDEDVMDSGHTNYYHRESCLREVRDRMEHYVPENPDEVVVGGDDALQTRVEGTSFYAGGDRREVALDVPGAFGGTSSHGNEYEYAGEPVWVVNDGEVVQKGKIDEIIHEEAHTVLILSREFPDSDLEPEV